MVVAAVGYGPVGDLDGPLYEIRFLAGRGEPVSIAYPFIGLCLDKVRAILPIGNFACTHFHRAIGMTHFNFSVAFLCGLLALPLASTKPAHSQQDTSALEAIVRSRICPADKTRYDELTYRGSNCATRCTRPELNGTPDCGGDGGLVGYDFQCQQAVDEKNRVIRAYNQFISACSSKAPQQTDRAPQKKPSPWADRAKEMERKAGGAEQINRDNAKSANKQAKQDAENLRREREQLEEDLRRQRERQEQIAREEEANRIPFGWVQCPCPADDMFLIAQGRAKLIHGILYHPRDVGPCGGS
jgi:hypothetical protein